eukprot:c9048_g1_i1 orf=49-303(+)
MYEQSKLSNKSEGDKGPSTKKVITNDLPPCSLALILGSLCYFLGSRLVGRTGGYSCEKEETEIQALYFWFLSLSLSFSHTHTHT